MTRPVRVAEINWTEYDRSVRDLDVAAEQGRRRQR